MTWWQAGKVSGCWLSGIWIQLFEVLQMFWAVDKNLKGVKDTGGT